MNTAKLQAPTSAALSTLAYSRCALAVILLLAPVAVAAQQSSSLNPFQQAVETESRRLSSSETEVRRDAVMRLGAMKRPESSRVAAAGLRDSSAIVRATAAKAVLSLPSEEAAVLLLSALQDRDEFVRRETAYALGETRSRSAVSPLVELLERDKEDSVRSSAAVALGQIGDESAVIALTQVLGRRVSASGLINRVRRRKKDENEFVRRAAARSLGQIGNRAAVPALSAVLLDELAPHDVRREAAVSLGLIGDATAAGALRKVLTSRDTYLSRIAYQSLLKISPNDATRPM